MAKSANLEPAENKSNLSRLLDTKVLQVNKLFAGSKFPTSANFVKLLIGVVLAFGVLIFFLNTVNFEKLKSQTFFLKDSQPPPLPPEEISNPPPPPEDILGTVEGTQTGCFDFDGDGHVTEADARIVLAYAGTVRGQDTRNAEGNTYDSRYDLNNDGAISIPWDVLMVTEQIDRVCGTVSSPTPTPTPTLTPPIIPDIQPSAQQCYQGQPRIPFGWGASVGASGYWVEISTSSNFSPLWRVQLPYQVSSDPATYFWWSASDPLFRDSSGNSHAPESMTTYFWRVLAYNQTNQVYSRISKFISINCSPSPTSTPSAAPTPLTIGCRGPLRIIALETDNRVVLTLVGVQDGCSGSIVWVSIFNRANRLISQTNCRISYPRCSTSQPAPPPGDYKVLAFADLDRDGRWYESGEYDKRILRITGAR